MTKNFYWQQPSSPIFDNEGRIQPLNCKRGDVANKIITVGDPNRAMKFQKFFDKDSVRIFQSNMIFIVFTGTYNGIPISVIGTGMGFAMVDLLMTQARAICDGPMIVLRFGTCGSLHKDVPIGCYALTDKTYAVRQNFEDKDFPYHITQEPVLMDEKLTKVLFDTFTKELPQYPTHIGSCFSADTFYGSQGREDPEFFNQNETVIEKVLKTDSNALNFEMEAYILAFLGRKFPEAQIRVAAICITLAQRTAEGQFLDNDSKYTMEEKAAEVLLKVISRE